MKNILQSGLALGIPTQHCTCVNMDFNWIFANPTNFLWLDNVIVTESMWSIITGTGPLGFVEESKQDSFSKAVRLVYSILDDVGMVKVISDNSITREEGDDLYKQIEDDIELLGDLVKEQGSRMKIGRHCYCAPALWSLYAALYLSRNNNACFMLDKSEIAFLKKVLPLKMGIPVRVASSTSAINEVLSLKFPEIELWHPYIADSINKCNKCVNEKKCKDEYLVVMTISAGLSLGGFFGEGVLSAIGGMGLLAAEVVEANISQVEKKHRWVNLFNKE